VRAAAALLAATLLTGCVSPSRTDDDYAHKAANTAEAVASSVNTARLGVKAAREHRITGPYVSRLMAEAEEDAQAATDALDSVQPPSADADALHARLDELTGEALDVLRALRIAVRRGYPATKLDEIAAPLGHLAEELDAFQEHAS
jgi:hypothetical protein